MRVLITRPKDDAEATAGILRARGYDPVIAPLLEIRYETDVRINSDIDVILATSANGIRALTKSTARRDFIVLAVGAQTAEEAKHAGFADVTSADGDVDDLAKLTAHTIPKTKKLLHVAGNETRGALAEKLRSEGFEAQTIAAYHAIASDTFPPEVNLAQIDAALFYSPRSAAIFVALAQGKPCHEILACCISPATTAALAELQFREIRVAERPNQDSLLAQLD
jgi:uroporphyrinogen-III synthase